MNSPLVSERLALAPLAVTDVNFIYELMNSPDWLRFIGDRNVKSIEDAERLVVALISNPNINYWIAKMRDSQVSVGIVSFVKREYLEFFDVGFAFLPAHTKKGFAYEATATFLTQLAREKSHPKVMATVIKDNSNSLALLKKLGFQFDHQVEVAGEELQVYSLSITEF